MLLNRVVGSRHSSEVMVLSWMSCMVEADKGFMVAQLQKEML